MKKKSKVFGFIWTVVFLAALVMFVYSGYQAFKIIREYKIADNAYSDMEKDYTTAEKDPEEELIKKLDVSEDGIIDPELVVDFEELKAQCKDVIGWIYYPAQGISYPLVQGEDNAFYLHHLINGRYNFAGSIFVEAMNEHPLAEPHTIIYGHNMKNGSMFGKLKRIKNDHDTVYSRTFWILTPEGTYQYRVFSAHNVKSAGEAYTIFSGPCQEFADWAMAMKAQSALPRTAEVIGENDRVVTLSTCMGVTSMRFIVQGVCLNPPEVVKDEPDPGITEDN